MSDMNSMVSKGHVSMLEADGIGVDESSVGVVSIHDDTPSMESYRKKREEKGYVPKATPPKQLPREYVEDYKARVHHWQREQVHKETLDARYGKQIDAHREEMNKRNARKRREAREAKEEQARTEKENMLQRTKDALKSSRNASDSIDDYYGNVVKQSSSVSEDAEPYKLSKEEIQSIKKSLEFDNKRSNQNKDEYTILNVFAFLGCLLAIVVPFITCLIFDQKVSDIIFFSCLGVMTLVFLLYLLFLYQFEMFHIMWRGSIGLLFVIIVEFMIMWVIISMINKEEEKDEKEEDPKEETNVDADAMNKDKDTK